jgi:muramidase (phage lysozyme)
VKDNCSISEADQQRKVERDNALQRMLLGIIAATFLLIWLTVLREREPALFSANSVYRDPIPLAMKGGDPYIRALMRTISASEASSPYPYSILYGGQHVYDLSQHPDRCIPIVAGPNVGQCTTAAGRYQFLSSTWLEKARLYHPQPANFLLWKDYSFEPQYQDEVVYRWLTNSGEWGVDIAQLLRQGQVNEVLSLLSGTWTSLGYGIENNSVTPELPRIYQKMLQEELATSSG